MRMSIRCFCFSTHELHRDVLGHTNTMETIRLGSGVLYRLLRYSPALLSDLSLKPPPSTEVPEPFEKLKMLQLS